MPYEAAKKRAEPYTKSVEELAEMRRDTVELVKQAAGENRKVYVLVNNRSEGNAPLTIRALLMRCKSRRRERYMFPSWLDPIGWLFAPMRPSGLVPLVLPFVLAGLGISVYVAYHQPATPWSHSESEERAISLITHNANRNLCNF